MAKNDRTMPDVAKSMIGTHPGTLDWVGMNKIKLPVTLRDANASTQKVASTAQIYVNLNKPQVKGIHMSRLYLLMTEFAESQIIDAVTLRMFLSTILESHKDISDQATLDINFEYLIKQPALISNNSGWKAYPTKISARLFDDKVDVEIAIEVPYSSTCPCSAALSRQILQQTFASDFAGKNNISISEVENWLRSEKGSTATPHSQRSAAKILVKLNDTEEGFPIYELIELTEKTLGTPVQTAVKREDEQEFARLNGTHMMFCEDAARRIKQALSKTKHLDFWLKVEHYESLHAHDAVAIATKGLLGGYSPRLEGY